MIFQYCYFSAWLIHFDSSVWSRWLFPVIGAMLDATNYPHGIHSIYSRILNTHFNLNFITTKHLFFIKLFVFWEKKRLATKNYNRALKMMMFFFFNLKSFLFQFFLSNPIWTYLNRIDWHIPKKDHWFFCLYENDI